MRKLKFHEQKLLKKVDFLQWKNEHNLREVQAMRQYHITDRDDYKKWVSKLTDTPMEAYCDAMCFM